MVNTVEIYVGIAINGIATGVGVTIGNYLAQRHLIERLGILKRIKGKLKRK